MKRGPDRWAEQALWAMVVVFALGVLLLFVALVVAVWRMVLGA